MKLTDQTYQMTSLREQMHYLNKPHTSFPLHAFTIIALNFSIFTNKLRGSILPVQGATKTPQKSKVLLKPLLEIYNFISDENFI